MEHSRERGVFALLAMLMLSAGVFAAGSLSLSLNSLDPISVGDSATLTATVSASGDSVSNVQVSVTLPTGLGTSDATTQNIGSLSSGQSSSKSWNITGNSADTYTITVSATGTSVTTQTSNATLTVNSPGLISVTETTKPASSLTSLSQTTSMVVSFSNTGGSSTQVTVSVSTSSGLTLINGSSSTTFDLNAGQSTSQTWSFRMDSVGNKTISAAITSTANNPDDLSYSITGPVTSGGGGTDTNASTTPATTKTPTTTAGPTSTGGPTGPTPATPAPAPAPKAPIVTIADVEDAAKIVKKVDYEPSVFTTPEGLQVSKAASYEEVRNSGGGTTPVYLFNVGVKNTTPLPLANVKVREVIPKKVASNVSQITFKEPPTVINPDPEVEWTVSQLLPGEEKKFVYFVTSLADKGIESSFGAYAKTLSASEVRVASEQPASPAQPPSPESSVPKEVPKELRGLWLAVGGAAGILIISAIIVALLFGAYWFVLRKKK